MSEPRQNDAQLDRDGERRDPVDELDMRADEMSPHQRALRVVLHMWSSLSVPTSVLVALGLATWVAWMRPGYINPLVLLLTYCVVGFPTALGLAASQKKIRQAIARRVLKKLDAPVRGALSGNETSVAFQRTRDADDQLKP